VRSTRFGKTAKWRRIADFASFILACSLRLATLPRQDKVLALTTPPLISFIGALRAKLWREKFCYWVMDFNPDEAIAAGWLRAGSSAAKLLELMSRFSLKSADRIIALDGFMRDRITAKGIPGEKVVVIPPWSQDHDVRYDAAGRERFRSENGWGAKFVVMYSGNITPVHPLDTLMDAAERLRDDSGILFCFIGEGGYLSHLKQRALRAGLTNVLFLPYQPLSALSASLSSADAHVVAMGNPFVGLVHPCKIYNILAVAAPVVYIGPSPSHVTEMFSEHGPEYPSARVRHGDAEELAAGIRKLRDETGSPRALPEGMARAFGKENLLPKLIRVLENA
jgi:glycosyltransferase involved in cell wall biosynthesis